MNKTNVYEIYNVIAGWFDSERSKDLKMEIEHLQKLCSYLKPNAKILDLGCGTGRPIAEFLLNRGFKVTAVDGSEKMIEIAKSYIPQATIILKDMRRLDLEEKFDAIIMWHSSFHLEQDDQRALFPNIAKHASKNAMLLFTSGSEQGEAWGINGGQDLFHASLSEDEYRELLSKNGFEVVYHLVEDKKSGGATIWLARKTN